MIKKVIKAPHFETDYLTWFITIMKLEVAHFLYGSKIPARLIGTILKALWEGVVFNLILYLFLTLHFFPF